MVGRRSPLEANGLPGVRRERAPSALPRRGLHDRRMPRPARTATSRRCRPRRELAELYRETAGSFLGSGLAGPMAALPRRRRRPVLRVPTPTDSPSSRAPVPARTRGSSTSACSQGALLATLVQERLPEGGRVRSLGLRGGRRARALEPRHRDGRLRGVRGATRGRVRHRARGERPRARSRAEGDPRRAAEAAGARGEARGLCPERSLAPGPRRRHAGHRSSIRRTISSTTGRDRSRGSSRPPASRSLTWRRTSGRRRATST